MRVLNPAVFPRALSGFAACGASHSLPASLPKRRVLAGLVTLISAVGTVPCVVLWLKAVSAGDVLLASQTGEVTRTLVPWSLDRVFVCRWSWALGHALMTVETWLRWIALRKKRETHTLRQAREAAQKAYCAR